MGNQVLNLQKKGIEFSNFFIKIKKNRRYIDKLPELRL